MVGKLLEIEEREAVGLFESTLAIPRKSRVLSLVWVVSKRIGFSVSYPVHEIDKADAGRFGTQGRYRSVRVDLSRGPAQH